MNELLEKDQVLSIVPKDFRNSNKGKILDIQQSIFTLEVAHAPEGIAPKKMMEFYSQTKNGMLYFVSHVTEIKDNILSVSVPVKHRFLQRRAFTRIKFIKAVDFELGENVYKAESLDISAGGMKIKVKESMDINSDYEFNVSLSPEQSIRCKYQPLKIEKNEDDSYTLSGRFDNLSNTDKMKLIQYCMRKNIENKNR